MTNGRYGWLLSLQTRLIVASAVIVVVAIFVTSGVFVVRDRQEQRAQTLKQIAAATQGFSVSTFGGGSVVQQFELQELQGAPGAVLNGKPALSVEPGVPGAGTGEGFNAAGRRDILSASDYRILLVNNAGEVVQDPAGALGGVTLSYPPTAAGDEKRGYVTWAGNTADATGGLTFLAPVSARLTPADGLTAIAAIDTTSLTADWLATAPDLAISALVGLPLAIVAVVLVTRRITHPLRSLTHAVEAMSLGDFDQRVDVRGRDEVATLASSFTVMAGRVKERDTQLRNLIANVSHDLRTPLTSIQGYAEALADGVAEPGDIDRVGRIIRDEARHASSLLANLLGLSEIESGEVVLRKSDYDIAELVERCLRRLGPRAEERGIEVHVQSIGVPVLHGDAEKVERAICNLLENAVKFARSRIDIVLGVDGTEARVSVRNDGATINAEDAERVFERFYRTGGPSAGTGLGLAIARELVELDGGSLELISLAPAEFRLSLPLP